MQPILPRWMLVTLSVFVIVFIWLVAADRANAVPWSEQCRENKHGPAYTYTEERKTVICAAATFNPPGGVLEALSVWGCERPAEPEAYHSDPHHGPYQFLISTYHHMQGAIPAIVHNYGLSHQVHNIRANILTAIAWSARHSWEPWGCA